MGYTADDSQGPRFIQNWNDEALTWQTARCVDFIERWLTWRERFIYSQMIDILEIENWANGEVGS